MTYKYLNRYYKILSRKIVMIDLDKKLITKFKKYPSTLEWIKSEPDIINISQEEFDNIYDRCQIEWL